MIRLIWTNTQEWLRLKFFQIVLFLSLLFVLFSQLLGSLSFTEQQRLIVDFGLAGIEISLVFVACFFSTHALAKDIDRKTILVLMSRPIPRFKIILGYFGSLVLLNLMAAFILGFTLFIFVKSPHFLFDLNYFVSVFFIYLKSLVVGGLGLLISVIARPMFAFVLSLTIWLMSYSVIEIKFFLEKAEVSYQSEIFSIFNYLFPQFYKFNWKSYGYLKAVLNPADVGWAFLHCLGWIVLSVYLASMLFRKKEIV